MLASCGTALERLLLCGGHYDIMQVDLIDLMEHTDMASLGFETILGNRELLEEILA